MARDREDKITRRGFIRDTAAAAALTTAVLHGGCRSPSSEVKTPAVSKGKPSPPAPTPAPKNEKRSAAAGSATVVLIRNADVLDKRGRPRARVMDAMLDEAVQVITGKEGPQAWKALLRPGDRLGIKSNIWQHLRTPEPLERSIARRAGWAGITADAVKVDDRGARKTLADATALINVRPLRSHHWAGVGGCIKNYIPFVAKPWTYHPDSCADLGALWNLPIVKGKTRLNVLLMLTPLFHGRGPHHFAPQYLWSYKGMIVSTDPVAADAVGVQILEEKRREHFGKVVPFSTPAKHIKVAETRHGIGVADPLRIDVIKRGWKG